MQMLYQGQYLSVHLIMGANITNFIETKIMTMSALAKGTNLSGMGT